MEAVEGLSKTTLIHTVDVRLSARTPKLSSMGMGYGTEARWKPTSKVEVEGVLDRGDL